MDSEPRSSRLSTSWNDQVIAKVTIREIAEDVDINIFSDWSFGHEESSGRIHDSAPAHSSHLIQTLLVKTETPVIRQAP